MARSSGRNSLRILWLRKFGLASANISQVMDEIALRGACIVSLADQHYFNADAVGKARRRQRHFRLVWLARIFIALLFLFISLGISAILRINPITVPTDNIYILGVIVLIFSLSLRFGLPLLESFTLSVLVGTLEIGHEIGERLRRGLVKLGLRPQGIEPFRAKFKSSMKKGKSAVFRVDDKNWQDAVRHSLYNVDVTVIDISHLTENIMWEVDTVVNSMELDRVRLICDEKTLENADQVELINSLMAPYYQKQRLPVLIYDLAGSGLNPESPMVRTLHGFVLSPLPKDFFHELPLQHSDRRFQAIRLHNDPQARERRRRRRR